MHAFIIEQERSDRMKLVHVYEWVLEKLQSLSSTVRAKKNQRIQAMIDTLTETKLSIDDKIRELELHLK